MVDAISDALAPWSEDLDVPEHPELVHLHNITHLGTTIEGTLRTRPDGRCPGRRWSSCRCSTPPRRWAACPREAALESDRPARGRLARPATPVRSAGWTVRATVGSSSASGP